MEKDKLICDLSLELDLTRIHLHECEQTINDYQAQMVIGGIHTKKMQQRLQMHEKKDATRMPTF